MPTWAINLLVAIVVKGLDYLTDRAERCQDTLCEIQAKFNAMASTDQEHLRRKLVKMFGITEDHLH